MNAADSDAAERDRPDGQQVHPPGQLVPAEQPQPEERGLQEERGQPLHRQRGAEDVADQPGVGPPVHPELELLHDPGDHADRHVDHQQRAEEPGQPQVLILLAAIPGRLQQRGQERQPDRDRDEEEMIDRHERELHPRQVNVRHWSPPVSHRAEAYPTAPGPWSSWRSRLIAALISDRWLKACGKLPSCSPVAADLLGVQAQVVGVGVHLLERQPGVVEPAGPGQGVDVPERAQGEGALVALEAVG